MKRRSTHTLGSGEDSFLDIIANLVGVLIILVAVVGTQAKSMILLQRADPEPPQELEQLLQQQQQVTIEALSAEAEIEVLQRDIAAEQARSSALNSIRHERLVDLEFARRMLNERLAEHDEQIRQSVAWQAELADYQSQWESLERQASLVESEIVTHHEIIEHFPTPIAKTVFSEEVHFRLEQGRLVFVPLDELVQRMRGEWKVKAEKLSKMPRTQEVVGPVDDFRLHYELVAETIQRPAQQVTVTQTLVRLDHFRIVPTRPGLGELLDQALQPNSRFQWHLSRYTPAKTTVSVWVYPDSFGEYNRLRNWLRERGYQAASWPLSSDRHISGSPDGLRTTAQ
ncbi:MAG TPA: hypothetical protein PKD54_04495 [Pirellulaceae bacterium]|nr:hypothetical protein [Pirellulaceae bacterium]